MKIPLEWAVQFSHPEKALEGMPGVDDASIAALFGAGVDEYRRARAAWAARARRTAEELLADTAFAGRVDRLPFAPGALVVGLGDSTTDDLQSWLEILRHALELRRPADGIRVLNAGRSGDTTTQLISRFLAVAEQRPDWVICYAGTNDARRHGREPRKPLVSLGETAENLAALRHFGATQTDAAWVWMTPASILEARIAADPFLGRLNQLAWRDADLEEIAEVVRARPEPVVDLRRAFGVPPDPALLLSDGLHPSLKGQKVILRTLVERLANP